MVAQFSESGLPGIVRAAALRQLELLGWTEGDAVYLRFFQPEGGFGAKLEATIPDLPWSQIEQLQAKGYGCYFVVNGGGHRDADVQKGRAIFYEHDNLDKETQLFLWQSLGLPEPTIQIDTGGKSIHNYWTLADDCTVEEWRSLQADLLEYADADRCLKNPSRVMRLAGALHTKTGQQSQIISSSGIKYSYVELRSIIPQRSQPAAHDAPTPETSWSSIAIPLELCLTKEHRHFIANGVGSGSRNNTGAALARDIIGTAARLDYLGISYSSDPRGLLDDYGSRCNPPLAARELDAIWKSAQKKNPTACLSDDALQNCVKAWQRNQQFPTRGTNSNRASGNYSGSSGGNYSSGSSNFPYSNAGNSADSTGLENDNDNALNGAGGGFPKSNNTPNGAGSDREPDRSKDRTAPQPTPPMLYNDIAQIVASSNNAEHQRALLIEYSYATGYPLAGLEKLASGIESQISRQLSAEEDKNQFTKLIRYGQHSFDLRKTLPLPLAKALLTKSESDRVDPVFFWQWLLPAVGIQLGAHIGIRGKEGSIEEDDWREFAIFWTMVVAPPSAGKSQTMSAIFAPIQKRYKKAKNAYKKQLLKLEKLQAAWDRMSPEEQEEKENTPQNPRVFSEEMQGAPAKKIIEVGSPEGAFKRMSELPPSSGCALAFDELIRLLMLDQYKDKGGDTRQILLQTFNKPSDLEFERSQQKDAFEFNRLCLQLTGGVQPEKAKKLASDADDGDGLLSRILPAIPTTPDNFDEWSDSKVSVYLMLEQMYDKLHSLHIRLRNFLPESYQVPDEDGLLEPVILDFNPEAKEIWEKWWSKLRREQRRNEYENPALAGFLGKTIGYTLRISLLLHCLDLCFEDELKPESLYVGVEPLERAIYAITYHIGQYRLLQSRNEQELSLPGQLVEMYQYLLRKQTAVNEVQIQNAVYRRCSKSAKPSLAQIRQNCSLLVANGVAERLNDGSKKFLIKAIPISMRGIPTNSALFSAATCSPEIKTEQGIQTPVVVIPTIPTTPPFSGTPSKESSEEGHILPDTGPPPDVSVEGDPLFDENCRNCRNAREHEPTEPEIEPVSDVIDGAENGAEDVGNSADNNDGSRDDDPPPTGGGNVPTRPTSPEDGGAAIANFSSQQQQSAPRATNTERPSSKAKGFGPTSSFFSKSRPKGKVVSNRAPQNKPKVPNDPIPADSPFQAGVKVRVVVGKYQGKVGTVGKYDAADDQYEVVGVESFSLWWMPKHLELATD